MSSFVPLQGLLGKEGAAASGHIAGEAPVLMGAGQVLPQVLHVAVEAAAALVRAAVQAPLLLLTMRLGVHLQVPLGEELPATDVACKASLVVHLPVLAQEGPLGEDLFTALHVTCVASMRALVRPQSAGQQEGLRTARLWAGIR